MSVVALSELLGASVRDASGAVRGRVREIAIAPQDHPTRIAFLIVKTPDGERVLPGDALTARRLDDQECDAGRMILRRDRDFTHPSADGAGGVAHGSAEQFGQCDD